MRTERNAPKKMKNQHLVFFLHENAPAHRSLLVEDFYAKNNVTTLEHPPYSPDLDPVDFYLFRRLKSALKRQRFCDATDIIKNATDELKRLSQSDFQECFQQLYSRWQMYIFAHGGIF
jgi:histone-lysine N-methyltransferase SETMAR